MKSERKALSPKRVLERQPAPPPASVPAPAIPGPATYLRRYVIRDADGNVARRGRVYALSHPEVKGRIGRTGATGDGLMITFCNRAPRGLDGAYVFIPQVQRHEMKAVEIID